MIYVNQEAEPSYHQPQFTFPERKESFLRPCIFQMLSSMLPKSIL